MTETQKRIKAYQEALPGLRERVVAVALLLAMSMAMMTSASFAWYTISRSPEVSGVNTTIASNGNLEIALATGDGKTPPGESKVGDSSAAEGQSIFAANQTWGNLINLADPAYGLDHLVLRPAQLNTAALLSKPLFGAVYNSDGRIKNLTSDYGYTAWVAATEKEPAHFGVSNDVGVRAISSIKREQLGYAADYNALYQTAEIANLNASNAYTAITQKQEWLDVLAKLLGIHMTASLNSEDQYKNATITPEEMESFIAMYAAFLDAHDQEADAIAKQLNLELFAAYGGNTTGYSQFSKDDILAINYNSDSRINSNGDFSYDVVVEKDGKVENKTIKITNLKAFLKDYKQLSDDLVTLNNIHAAKDYRWTAGGIYKVVERLMDVNKCLIKKQSEKTYKTVSELMKEFSDSYTTALGYMNSSCDIVITNGVLYNLEQRVGSTVNIQNMPVEAKMYVSSLSYEAKATVKAYVTTSATKPSDFAVDLAYANDTLNTGADNSSGQAVAEDTYALAVDFWVRTNAVNSYLTLEGNVLLGEAYEVPVMTVDPNGNPVPLYTLTLVATDEETGESIPTKLDVYKLEEDGTTVWHLAETHAVVTEDIMGDAEPVAQVEEQRDVIGYEGENRVWDKNSKDYLTVDSTTQGVGSCYVYYADSPEDQARSLELLKSLSVAFVDSKGALLATASMDTENFYGNSGRFVVPLKINNDGVSITTTAESGEEVVEYAITALRQNEPTRLTAIVYLDGRELNNEDVLSAADIQGQLNIQFGNNTEMQPIENEKLEYQTRTVSASVDNTSFEYDTYVGDMISKVTVHVDGDAPTNVKAFFMRKVNATQGSREDEMIFTKNASGDWEASYTFTAPGVYVLRSVYLDGVEYVLADAPEVTITGFTIESLNCDQTGEGRHVDVLTAANTSKLDLKLKFATDDESKLPSTVQGRFLRNEDGAAVNINFTYNPTTRIWSGSGTFLNSGEYTMQYLYLNGEPTGLDEDLWITANIKLGMKAAVYTKDITEFKFAPDEMVANGTDQLQMQVKIMDNSGAELPGLGGVKLTYRLKNSSSTVDTDLTWNGSSKYYEGDIQALAAGAGVWEFAYITIGGENTIANATTYPVFEMLSPEPPSYVRIGGTGMLYRPNGDAQMQVTLKYSATSTVAAVFRDDSGNRYPVLGTAGTTNNDTNETIWNFTVPTNRTGANSGKQDGYWTIETVYIWNYYTSAGNYVKWDKDADGNLKGGLSLNSDGSLAENTNRDDTNAMSIDIKTNNNGNAYRVKVVQSVKVDFTAGQKSADFGKSGTTVTGAFMDSYTISNLQVKITDFEGKAVGSDLSMTITYNNGTSTYYGGYTSNDLANANISYTTQLTADSSGTVFTQATPITLRYAGTYTTTFEFKLNGATAKLTNAGVQAVGEIPQFTVSSVKPNVEIYALSPAVGTAYGSLDANGNSKNRTTELNGREIKIFPAVSISTKESGCDTVNVYDVTKQPKVTLQLTGMGNATKANLVFVNQSAGQTVYLYAANANADDTRTSDTATDAYEWSAGTDTSTRCVGNYKDAEGCNAQNSLVAAGTIVSNDYVTLEWSDGTTTISVTVAIDPITINQQVD